MDKTMRTLCLCWFSLLVAAVSLNRATGADGKEPKHLYEALKLVAHLKLENTSYGHGKPDVHFANPYRSHADFSGFLDALLQHSYGCTPKQFEEWFGQK